MSRRYTVVHCDKFAAQLAALWLLDHEMTRSMHELDVILRTIPDQAGQPLYHHDEQLWHIEHRAIEILYRIVEEDCQVQLISIRLTRTQ